LCREYEELNSLPLELDYGMETFDKAIFRLAGDIEPEEWESEEDEWETEEESVDDSTSAEAGRD
jgi:hypothetical protein